MSETAVADEHEVTESEVEESTNIESEETADGDDPVAVSLYEHVKELAQIKYDNELRREDSLVTQSSNMQTAFSFMTAAVFMALPIIIEHRGTISLNYIFVAVSSVVLSLLVSLALASIAQRRVKKQALDDIEALENFVSNNWECTQKKSQQLKQWVSVMSDVQKSLTKANDNRVAFIQWSMRFLWLSIALIAFWYFSAIAQFL